MEEKKEEEKPKAENRYISSLESKKYCNPLHSTKIEFLCTEDETLCCGECAGDHSHHFEKLEDIKSIFESKLVQYRKLKAKMGVLTKMQTTSDEIRSYIAFQLETAFDQLITKVKELKDSWIEEHFAVIMKVLGVNLEQNAPDLTYMSNQIDEVFHNIQSFINSDSHNIQQIINLKRVEEFEPELDIILLKANTRKQYKNIKVKINFDPVCIRKMLSIEGYAKFTYLGGILEKEDLDFVASQLQRPVESLKMLYSGKRDGLSASTFHERCDGVGDTLVIARANGHVFGGYAKPQWHQRGEYSQDISKESFLFTCRNQSKHSLIKPNNAIYGRYDCGPTFGFGWDLYINHTNGGYSALRNSYSMPLGGKQEEYMAGKGHGAPILYDDYEVHQIIFE